MDKKVAQKLVDKTRKDYNRIYRKFSSTRSYIWPDIGFAIEALKVKKDDKILDVGCGNGRFVPLFEKDGANYTGLDLSEKLLEVAKSNYPNAKFVHGDATTLPFKDNEFNVVISIATLHHIPSLELRKQAVKELHRVLNKKGKLTVSVWYFWGQPKYLKMILPEMAKWLVGRSKLDFADYLKPWDKGGDGGVTTNRYFHAFRKKELKKLILEAGFRDIEAKVSDRNLIFTAKK